MKWHQHHTFLSRPLADPRFGVFTFGQLSSVLIRGLLSKPAGVFVAVPPTMAARVLPDENDVTADRKPADCCRSKANTPLTRLNLRTMSDLPFLLTEDVTKRYGTDSAPCEALRGIDFSAEAGEFVAIQGPSGCGKSTLLHILGAMDRPTTGKVWLNGRRIDILSPDELAILRRRHVGFVFQAFNLLPTLNVQENVSLPLLLDGRPERQSADQAAAALADVGLRNRSHHYPSQLSGGEMQRAAIARALAIQPDIVIADEPTGSLDSTNGQRVLELLAELNDSQAITVLMATHSEQAAAFASRVIHVKDGRLDPETGTDVLPAAV